ncbi:hypothetical protein EDEG_00708 [Edhazardia aedis USNM 41457]|uniref:Uncharacterized protein n=1 Tax=Edhazardia aedis (strain USNM 41457) TaxID=1003232 RepID=J9A013_EDHAE|nr:hypothetical protein EDEG_00708 [Edhazardia aedis USNM 41457]|eukprot:EJW05243.1 hypothetical protein EDEG_00708 [Edhazardia aedis USNM 41457]
MTMNIGARNFIVIKGDVNKIIDISGNSKESFVLTEKSGYTLVKVCHSNTFIISDHCENQIFNVSAVYEPIETSIDFVKLNEIFNFSDEFLQNDEIAYLNTNASEFVFKFSDYKNIYIINLGLISTMFGLGMEQLKCLITKFRLIHFKDNLYLRLSFKTLRKVLTVYRSHIFMQENPENLTKYFPEYICSFLKSNFVGNSVELTAFLLLELYILDPKNYLRLFKKSCEDIIIENFDKIYLKDLLNTIYFKDMNKIVTDMEKIEI